MDSGNLGRLLLRKLFKLLRTSAYLPALAYYLISAGLLSAADLGALPASNIADSHHEIIVSVKDQKLVLLTDGKADGFYPVSTSRYGIGDGMGSYATPKGKLMVKAKIGMGQPLGAVFKSRTPTGEILKPDTTGRDPIVTRILWLEGTEPCNRNAFQRGIYIHGTPQENLLGRPASFGCIRMRSIDVAALCERVGTGATVRILTDHLPVHESLLKQFLDANRFVSVQTSTPKTLSQAKAEEHPETLNQKPQQKLLAVNFPHQHSHGEIEFVGKGEKS